MDLSEASDGSCYLMINIDHFGALKIVTTTMSTKILQFEAINVSFYLTKNGEVLHVPINRDQKGQNY